MGTKVYYVGTKVYYVGTNVYYMGTNVYYMGTIVKVNYRSKVIIARLIQRTTA